MPLFVQRPAVATPGAPHGATVRAFFEEHLASSSVAHVPRSFEFSGDPDRRLGEEAEKKVFDAVGQVGIPGVRIICFNGVRVVGRCPLILRELDFCLFVTYQGRHYVFIMEVKCNAQPESSRGTSKKALGQLRTFKDMLESELNVETSSLQMHAVWPHMEPTEPCPSCLGSHPSLYERPVACRQAGTQSRTNPEPEGFHIFKDSFENGKFSEWMRKVICDPMSSLEAATFDTILDFVARHCVGVLYDEAVKSFCILGDDQARLLKRKEQPLLEPTIIYGLAGTGKTISILSRIQQISTKLSSSCRALYVAFEENAIAMVKRKLKACQVDPTYITFANHDTFNHSFKDLSRNDKVTLDLIRQGYRYIYLDSTEDLGVDWVNGVLKKRLAPTENSTKLMLTDIAEPAWLRHEAESGLRPVYIDLTQICGDFWITVDPFQGLNDYHYLSTGSRKQVHWRGNLIDSSVLNKGSKLDKFVKLNECFRMPLNIVDHINRERVLPTKELPKARDVRSRGVIVEDISFPVAGFNPQALTKELARQLHQKAMVPGIHPGHCAIVYKDSSVNDFFPADKGGVTAFVESVNSNLRGLSVKRQASHMLQVTQDIRQSLLYNQSACDISPVPPMPLTLAPQSSDSVEGTAEYMMERHCEVMLKTTICFSCPGQFN